MPRKRRAQPGTSGGAYDNRTDLSQPVAVPTGLPYGEGQALAQAQQQAPLPQQAPGPQVDPAVEAAQAHNFQATHLAAPSNRPHEPIQHGLPSGPGAGPEVLQPQQGTSASLNLLAQQTGNPAIAAMAARAARFGI
jgi:hypothetical protein